MTPGETIDYYQSAGYRLRFAREQLSLSIKDVANALNLLVNHVRAIEANRYDALADDEEFLHHLHDYASLVDLDANEIVDVYRTQSAAISEEVQPQPAENKKRHHGTWMGVGVLTLVCVCLGIWWLTQTTLLSESSDTATYRYETTEDKRSNAPQLPTNDAGSLPPGAATSVSVPPAIDRGKETLPTGKKNTPAGNEAAALDQQTVPKPNQAQSTDGADSNAIIHDPDNANLGKSAMFAVGAAPLKKTLVELQKDDSAQGSTPASIRPVHVDASTQMRSTAWFASLDPDRYTLQLLSFTREESSRAFIQRRHLQEDTAYFAVRNDDGQTWYAVTYGLYDSYQAAESASKSLPESLKDLKPRVRNTGRIQQLMGSVAVEGDMTP